MNTVLFFLVLLVTPLIWAAQKKPSSEVPARREFPLSSKVKPCEDFHKYVCSEAESSFKLRDDRSIHMFAFSDSRERLLEVKKKFMKDLASEKDLTPRTRQIQSFYNACMDTAQRKIEEKAFVEETKTKLAAIKTSGELIERMNQNIGRDLGGFMALWPSANADEPLRIDATLYINMMLLPEHDYYSRPEVMASLSNLLKEFFLTVEPKIKVSTARKRADALLNMQKEFIKTYPRPAVQRQRWAEKRDISQKDFLEKYPQLKAQLVLTELPPSVRINLPIYEGFDFIAANLDKIPLETWKDYLLVDFLYDRLDEAYPKFFKQKFEMEKKFFGGPVKRADLQERCTNMATSYFMRELDAALVDQVFPSFDESKVHEVGEKVRRAIIKGMGKNTWLSPEGREGAIKKIKNARLQMVKPHSDKEWDFTPQRKYSGKFIENLRIYAGARWEKAMKEVREPANQDAWGMGPLTVNAYYNANENKFVMPVGILQYPFYDSAGSLIENIGAVGAVIGHELGHGIDDNGSRYDYQGRLKPWMPTKDVMEFNRRSQKMIEQFDKAGFDGRLTLGENVADLVGLTFAYQAAFPEGSQPSAEDQRKFFVSYGRIWCEVVRPDYATLLKKTDSHSAGRARINEQVKHQAAFEKAFSCKAGDKMVLPDSERIQIW